jgi:hypothetical protein
MNFVEIGWAGVDWICLGKDKHKWRAHVKVVMHFWVLKMLGNLSSGYRTHCLSSSGQLHRVSSAFEAACCTQVISIIVIKTCVMMEITFWICASSSGGGGSGDSGV